MGVWILILLILFNAAFVVIEMALVSSRRAMLEARAERGDRSARTAVRLLDRPNLYLSTVQIGITASGVLLGAFGEEAVAERLAAWMTGAFPPAAAYSAPIALAATVAGLTFVIIVLGELVPKRVAQMAPETIARVGARPMWIMSRVCRPLVWLLSAATNVVLRVVPVKDRRGSGEDAEREVRALIASGARSGLFHRAEQQIVERVFKLSDQSVKAVMVPRTEVEFLRLDETPQRIRAMLATSVHSHFPVCKTGLDDLVGVVHVKDLVRQTLVREEIRLSEVVKPPLFVPESTPAIEMVELFRKQRTHIAFVLDEYGVVEGLVTLYDVVEALVGEVQRQGEVDEPMIVKRPDGSYLLDGRLSIAELRDLMRVEKLPKEGLAGYETLGGLVMTYLGRIPATGDRFTWREFTFEVVDMDKARVDKVMLSVGAAAAQAG
ncbi:MAG: hemolysin family protein [Phycisphaerales bacterium]